MCECVISDSNPFLGKKLSEISSLFSDKYKVGIIAVRSKDWNSDTETTHKGDDIVNETSIAIQLDEGVELTSQSSEQKVATEEEQSNDQTIQVQKTETQLFFEKLTTRPVGEHILQYGDVILCVAESSSLQNLQTSRDFFVVSTVGNLPKPLDYWNSVAVVIFLVMMILVATENIDMCPAALTVTCVFFIGGWVKYHEIPKLVDIRLLMLMGCSLSFAKAMTKTGLALRIAQEISTSDPSPFQGILLIYAVTLVITELISNNAAAALMYPIAVALADELKVISQFYFHNPF